MDGESELHARVSVLESDVRRHDEDIKDLWKETTDLKMCAASLPAISSDLREIKKTVQFLNECKIAQESVDKGKRGVLRDNLWWIKEIFLLVMGAVVIVLWSSAMHLQIGVPK